MTSERNKFTSLENLFLKTPLYEEIAIEKHEAIVKEILFYDGALGANRCVSDNKLSLWGVVHAARPMVSKVRWSSSRSVT